VVLAHRLEEVASRVYCCKDSTSGRGAYMAFHVLCMMTRVSRSGWDHLAAQVKMFPRAGFTTLWIPPPLKGSSSFSNGYDAFDDYDLGGKDQKGGRQRGMALANNLSAASRSCAPVGSTLVENSQYYKSAVSETVARLANISHGTAVWRRYGKHRKCLAHPPKLTASGSGQHALSARGY
jgi:hypothetical protein